VPRLLVIQALLGDGAQLLIDSREQLI
jgi:hypothetical protein